MMDKPPLTFPVASAQTTTNMTLTELIQRISARPEVDAIIIVGSGGRGTLNSASDYDVLVVLADAEVIPECVLTMVDQRNTEVYFTTTEAIDRIVKHTDQIHHASMLGGCADRIAFGQIVFDRSRRLVQAQAAIRRDYAPVPGETLMYDAWFNANYDLWQTKRILRSDDTIYLTAVDYRLLGALSDLLPRYFTVRRLPWRGEKDAIQHIHTHDPAYLSLYRECLMEEHRARKCELYEELLQQALTPVGGLWDHDVTVASIDQRSRWLSTFGDTSFRHQN